jgi:hypothetical protein
MAAEAAPGRRAAPAAGTHAKPTSWGIPRFGIFEHTLTQQKNHGGIQTLPGEDWVHEAMNSYSCLSNQTVRTQSLASETPMPRRKQQGQKTDSLEAAKRDADWLMAARYGVFMHFLPEDAQGLARVNEFDVEALAKQLDSIGAKYFVLTLGQNSGYFNSPNATYDRLAGCTAGERCAGRDLPLDLYRALHPRGIRLMLYLPCQVPNEDARAQKAFGLPEGRRDQPIDLAFAHKWAAVIQEWSDRYGDKVSGWWFDGGYEWIHFNDAIAEVYARAAKHGNPHSLVTFNPGVKLIRWTRAEDYTAGELNEPFSILPLSRWLDGSQWHALTFLGSHWSARDTRYPAAEWANWVKRVTAAGGVATLDMGPNWNPKEGPIGCLSAAQVEQMQAIKTAVRGAA